MAAQPKARTNLSYQLNTLNIKDKENKPTDVCTIRNTLSHTYIIIVFVVVIWPYC